MPAKTIAFTSASRATQDDGYLSEQVKLKRERSPQLHNLIGFFQRQEQQIFSVQYSPVEGDILSILERKIQQRLFAKNRPMFLTFGSERGPWASLETPNPFFGVLNGLYHRRGVEGEEHSYIQTLKEWKGPESENAICIPPPHVKISVSHNCDAPENALLGTK
ncbi:hypothetical protein PENSOL_c013G03419 [Penicillium solitum]|uniref:Uncharacterized protein n=1 Tax=Penicillium solitum TaxID=60172 RepID=A0A1V6R7K6_9EURO|nr:uncharacterized protein PENSOL_c013G03419 [Penicillium solitum]OQD97182.1 hypothetical protein PENSOL_c013G03419 [Penicillium solitum]